MAGHTGYKGYQYKNNDDTITIAPAILGTDAVDLNQITGGTLAGVFSNLTDTALTLGSVVFAGTGGLLSQNNTNFYWDDPDVQLRIGTGVYSGVDGFSSTPLLVKGSQTYFSAITNSNRNPGVSSSADMVCGNDADDGTLLTGHYIDMGINSSNYSDLTTPVLGGANNGYLYVNRGNLTIGTGDTVGGVINFFVNGSTSFATSSIVGTFSTTAYTLRVRETWATGLGLLTHIVGPTDTLLGISAGTPATPPSGSTAGRDLNLNASNAVTSGIGSGFAAGGAVNITSGNGATITASGGNGGAITLLPGTGTGSGSASGGAVNISGGNAISLSGSGAVNISTKGNASGSPSTIGQLNITTGTGLATGSGGSGNAGGNMVVTLGGAGSAGGGYTGTGANAGGLTFTLGIGGSGATIAGSFTAGNGSAFTITGGAGGNSTGVNAGTNTAGTGSSIAITAGAGGSASGGLVANLAGPGGTITLTGGNGNATGTGSPTAGIGGDVNLVGGNSAAVGSSPRAGNINLTAGNSGNTGGGSNGGNITLTAGKPQTNGGRVILQTTAGGGSGGQINIIHTDLTTILSDPGSVNITTASQLGGLGGNAGGQAGAAFNLTTGKGIGDTGGGATTASGGNGGAMTLTLGKGGNMTSGSVSATGGNAGAYSLIGGIGGTATNTGTQLAGNGSSFTFTTGAGGNATGASGSRTGGNAGNYTINLGAGGTGATANGTAGQFSISQTLSGSDATSMVSLTPTWNTTGTPTAIKLNVTNTASNAGSLLLDLQVGGTSQFKVDVSGRTILNNVVRLKGYTVATLPAGTTGDTAYATDLLLPAFLAVAVGGGAVVGPVFFNGAQWVSI